MTLRYLALSLIAVFVSLASAQAEDVQYDMRVDGVTCPFCVATSSKELKKIEGVHEVSADLEAGIISVCAEDSVVFTDDQLKKLFRKKGFTFREFTQVGGCAIEGHPHEARGHDRADDEADPVHETHGGAGS